MNLTHTPVSGLTLDKIEGFNGTLNKYVSGWQHRDRDGRQVGPFYPTKQQALVDTDEYAESRAFHRAVASLPSGSHGKQQKGGA